MCKTIECCGRCSNHNETINYSPEDINILNKENPSAIPIFGRCDLGLYPGSTSICQSCLKPEMFRNKLKSVL